MPQLRITHQGHVLLIDPETGQIHTHHQAEPATWTSWSRARKALAGKSPTQPPLLRREGCLVSEGDCRPLAVWYNANRIMERVELLDTGDIIAASDLRFPDVALAGARATDEQIQVRRQVLGDRSARLAQQQAFLDEARNAGAIREGTIAVKVSTSSMEGWKEDGRGGLEHERGWTLAAVLHGKTGSFLGFHLGHRTSGWLRMVTSPQLATACVASLVGSPEINKEFVAWKENETALDALFNGRVRTLVACAGLGSHEVWLVREQEKILVMDAPGASGALWDERARDWWRFAQNHWAAWTQEEERVHAAGGGLVDL